MRDTDGHTCHVWELGSSEREREKTRESESERECCSTHQKKSHWRRGVVLTQDPFELFGVPLLIVKTGRGIRLGQPAPMPPPDHYGCSLGCKCFTGTMAAVEEHERGCAHALERLLPEGFGSNGDEDELALTLLDIVEPLQ